MCARRLLAAFLRICQKTIWIPIAANVEPQTNCCCTSQLCQKHPLQIVRIKGCWIYRSGQKHRVLPASPWLDKHHTIFLNYPNYLLIIWQVVDCFTATRQGLTSCFTIYQDGQGMFRFSGGSSETWITSIKSRVEELNRYPPWKKQLSSLLFVFYLLLETNGTSLFVSNFRLKKVYSS